MSFDFSSVLSKVATAGKNFFNKGLQNVEGNKNSGSIFEAMNKIGIDNKESLTEAIGKFKADPKSFLADAGEKLGKDDFRFNIGNGKSFDGKMVLGELSKLAGRFTTEA